MPQKMKSCYMDFINSQTVLDNTIIIKNRKALHNRGSLSIKTKSCFARG